MKLYDNAVKLAYSIYPTRREIVSQRSFHFCFVYRRNKLLVIGQNNMVDTSNKARQLYKYFSINHPYYYQHAETDAISRLWGKTHIDNSLKFVVIRIDRMGNLADSKPCRRCQSIFNGLGVTKVLWSKKSEFDS